ncbi:lipopolysaccharide biosynthesis protein [Phenylobacterium sp.]|uniref:lipopolysaccharide biosynthesis protein n=1 Tax=Phenylobacterium sp. TaxID=1871053 RepID=UPI002F92785E
MNPFPKFAQATRTALSDRSLIRDIATLGGGAIAAQVINFGFYPLLTRQYTPGDFGDLGIFMSFIAVLTPVAGLAYYWAIILPTSERRALRILIVSCISGIGLSGVLAIAIAVLSRVGGLAALQLRHEGVAHLLAPCLAFMAIMLALQQWQTRDRQFVRLSLSGLVQTLTANVPRAILGFQGPNSLTLVVTYVVSIVAQTAFLIPWGRMAAFARRPFSISVKQLWVTAWEYRRYPLFRAPQDWLSATSQSLPVLLLGFFYGPTEAGLYVLSRSIIGAPLDLVGNAVGGAIYPRYAEASNGGVSIAPPIRQHILVLLIFGITPLVAITPFLPWGFSVLFGNEWLEAGQYGMFLGAWLFSNLLTVPCIRAVPVLAAERLQLGLGVMTMIGRAAALGGTAAIGGSALTAVALYCVFGILANLVVTWAIYDRARVQGNSLPTAGLPRSSVSSN